MPESCTLRTLPKMKLSLLFKFFCVHKHSFMVVIKPGTRWKILTNGFLVSFRGTSREPQGLWASHTAQRTE